MASNEFRRLVEILPLPSPFCQASTSEFFAVRLERGRKRPRSTARMRSVHKTPLSRGMSATFRAAKHNATPAPNPTPSRPGGAGQGQASRRAGCRRRQCRTSAATPSVGGSKARWVGAGRTRSRPMPQHPQLVGVDSYVHPPEFLKRGYVCPHQSALFLDGSFRIF
jgi:hypothetical protein